MGNLNQTKMELSPFLLSLLKWSLVLIVLLIAVVIVIRNQSFRRGTSVKNTSFKPKRKPYAAEIVLTKSQRYNPSNIMMTVTNTGTAAIDLNAPVIIFRRWFSNRKFRVLKVEHSEVYPIFLEPNSSSELDISLNQFYDAYPELQLAYHLRIEMLDHKGKKHKSQSIRLKWF
jgi:hypothetical protein